MLKILVLYHSQQYGNTEQMAKAVGEGVRLAGAEAILHNTNDARLPMDVYRACDGAAFGTPDYFGYMAGTLKTFLDDWYLANRTSPENLLEKPFALFLSHGGGGRVQKHFQVLFSQLGHQLGETVVCQGAPDDLVLAACQSLGKALVESIPA